MRFALILLPLAAALAGCAGNTYIGARTTVVQDKFDHLTCAQIDAGIKATEKQVADLQRLQARAAQDAGGAVIGTAVYGAPLAQAQGNLRIYRETRASKACPST